MWPLSSDEHLQKAHIFQHAVLNLKAHETEKISNPEKKPFEKRIFYSRSLSYFLYEFLFHLFVFLFMYSSYMYSSILFSLISIQIRTHKYKQRQNNQAHEQKHKRRKRHEVSRAFEAYAVHTPIKWRVQYTRKLLFPVIVLGASSPEIRGRGATAAHPEQRRRNTRGN